MRIYISTPINARGEATFEEKYEAARKRAEEIAAWLKTQQPEAETVSTFDGRPKPDGSTEAEAIGRCVQQEPKYDDTHMVKGDVPKEVRELLTEEQLRALPILGNMRPLQRAQQQMAVNGTVQIAQGEGEDYALPF